MHILLSSSGTSVKQSLQVAKANSVQVLPKQQCVVFSSLVSCLRRHGANSDSTEAERRKVSLQLAQDLWMPSLKTEEVHKKTSNKNSNVMCDESLIEQMLDFGPHDMDLLFVFTHECVNEHWPCILWTRQLY